MKTNTRILKESQDYYQKYDIDLRTLPIIVKHYLSIGEQAASDLDENKISKLYEKAVKREKEAEAKGEVLLVSPHFESYILTACMGLNKLPDEVKYHIIKENL